MEADDAVVSGDRRLIEMLVESMDKAEGLSWALNVACGLAFDMGRPRPPQCFWCRALLPDDREAVLSHVAWCDERKFPDPVVERIAQSVESLLSVPLATNDFLEGVRRAALLVRAGPTTTAVDAEGKL